ncbi:MAG: orotidine-5'-phosphate decarboxylase [Acidiphilium sp.]|nr:orotidine-5'-phosphate decarboxylase [Acidiphilium sp.]
MDAPIKRLIAAIDTPDAARARELIGAVGPHCGLIKLGLEIFSALGPTAFEGPLPCPVFLDVKLHDIPNTVAGAVRALLPLRPAMLTIHAAGGAAMIEAARKAAGSADHRPLILAVTVLTSLDARDLAATGIADDPRAQVLRLARLALASGADGLVCSADEIAVLRDEFGPAPILVVPGIRPAGSDVGDQARIATPRDAIARGASYIVVGRPITAAADPAAAAAAIAGSIT